MSPLVVDKVVKHYRQGDRDVAALNGVSLDVAAGAFMAIMGASGSGKSTLLHLMAGLTKCDSGTVRVNGADLGGMNDKQLTLFRRRSIGRPMYPIAPQSSSPFQDGMRRGYVDI